MGMGYGANTVDTIEEKSVETMCPVEYNAFMQAIKDAGIESVEEFAISIVGGDDGKDLETGQTFASLCNKFKESTGLTVGIGYHDSEDDGSRYDEIEGYYWWVYEVYEMTKEAKSFEELGHSITRKQFVTFG
jgi:hypothetical protein